MTRHLSTSLTYLGIAPTVGDMATPVDRCDEHFAWRETGSGPTVLFLHGLGGSRISWEPQLASLSDRWRCVAWDLPGYGAAPPLAGSVTFTALADAAARLIDTLHAPAHVAGISMGGMIAQYVAARHPASVVSLAVLASSPKFGLDGTDPATWKAARLAPLDAGLEPADFAEQVLRNLASPTISAEAFAQQVAAMRRVSAAALRRSIECLITHDSRALLDSITAATVCMVGSEDTETPEAYSRAIADGIGRSTPVVVVPGAGHLLNAEAPAAVDHVLRQHWAHAEETR